MKPIQNVDSFPARKRAQMILSVLLLVLLLPATVLGDGKVFPRFGVKADPTIPRQRALLAWQAGVESLTIQTHIDAQSQELGWIIPLPAAPTSMTKVSPGALESLDFAFHPLVKIDGGNVLFWYLLVSGLFMSLMAGEAWYRWRTGKNKLPRLISSCSLVLLLMLFLILLLPRVFNVQGGLGPMGQGTTILERMQVGSYDCAVLRARTAADLDRWLTDNRYRQLERTDKEVVKAYIDAGWIFVTTRLRREREGLSTPHPIRFTFPTDRAIYPLKFTGAGATEPLALELFIFGEKQAAVGGMTLELADRVKAEFEPPHPGLTLLEQSQLKSRHPQIIEEAWQDCVFTRLSGTFDPGVMDRDLYLEWGELDPFRKVYWTSPAAITWATVTAMGAINLGLLVIALFILGGKNRRNRQYRFAPHLLLPLLLIAGVTWVVTWLPLEVVPANQARLATARWADDELSFEIYLFLEGEGADLLQGNITTFCKGLDLWLAKNKVTNPRTNKPPIHMDSPGNYRVVKEKDGLQVYVYNKFGEAVSVLDYYR